ncbi:MAG: hypothetical protein IPG45_20255 [Deltaproteobacteria bacterium]|jgi:hypothetical protein|nr:hypothetical protein [Deltaproteobacteria bacterium]
MGTFAEEQSQGLAEIYEKAAKDIMGDLQLVLHEPELSPGATELERFAKIDHGWYRSTTKALEEKGFRVLRDLDGTPLTAKGSPPPAIRVLLSGDGRSSAALYHVMPRSPGFFMKSLLFLMGKWQTARIVELTSYDESNRVWITVNQGDVNPFASAPNVSRRHLPIKTGLAALLEAHQSHLAGATAPLRTFRGFEDLDAARRAQREVQNQWRNQVGLLKEELDRMLAPHGKHGEAIRPYLERALKLRDLRG